MPFYVPLGPRGFVFHFGTLINNVLGYWIYRRASRRRALLPSGPLAAPDLSPGNLT